MNTEYLKFEYRTMEYRDQSFTPTRLEELGGYGWEVVCVLSYSKAFDGGLDATRLLLKRIKRLENES